MPNNQRRRLRVAIPRMVSFIDEQPQITMNTGLLKQLTGGKIHSRSITTTSTSPPVSKQ